MRYKVFSKFFDETINYLVKEELTTFKFNIDAILYEKIYMHIVSIVELDLIQSIYAEYNNYSKIHGKDISLFSTYIGTKEYVKSFFEKYHIAYKCLVTKINGIIDFIISINNLYIKDKKEIDKKILGEAGNIIDIIPLQGDLHNNKSASKVITDKGTIYYKPVTAANMKMFYSLLDFIFSERKDIKYRKLKYVAGCDYTWMEEIKYQTCTDMKEVEEYFFISGVYLMCFYILGSFDMHFENVISAGNTPVIIDFETLANVPVTTSYEVTDFKDSIYSVLNTAFIPFVNEGGAFDINLSGILCKSQESDIAEDYVYKADEEHGFVVEKLKSGFNIINEITLNNRIVVEEILSLEQIRELIQSGFQFAGNYVLSHKNEVEKLLEDEFTNLDLEFRQLLRPTQVYHQFVESCKHPIALSTELERDKILSILEKNFKPSKHGYLRVEEEIKSIKKWNIPKFYTKVNEPNLYSDGELICEDFYSITVHDLVKKRLENLDEKQIQYQMYMIDLSLFSITKNHNLGSTIIKDKSATGYIDMEYVHQTVGEITSFLLKNSIHHSNNVSGVMLPHLTDNKLMWRIKEFSANMYEDGGTILLAAYFGYFFDESDVLEESIHFLNYVNLFLKEDKLKNMSVYSGKGSLLYLNYNMSVLLGKKEKYNKLSKEYKQLWKEMANNFLDNIISNGIDMEEFDYMGGSISEIYLLAKIYLVEKDEKLKEKLILISNAITSSLNCNQIAEVGFAHGITGVVVCLSKLMSATGDKNILPIIEGLLSKENVLINKSYGEIKSTWCKGIPGILHGRHIIKDDVLKIVNKSHKIIEVINAPLKKLETDDEFYRFFELENIGLCHGVYGNIMVLQKLGYDSRFYDLMYKKYFNSFNDLNWINNLDVPYNSFMLGSTGVAYALMKLMFKKIPDILSLDLFL